MTEQQPDPWQAPKSPYGPPPVPPPVPPAAPAYGQPDYGQQTYGQPAYGQPAYGQPGYPNPRSVEASSVRNQAILWLIVNIIAVLSCCSLPSIGGIVTSSLALNRVDTDVASARRLVRWSWLLPLAWLGVLVVAVIGFIVFVTMTSTSNSG